MPYVMQVVYCNEMQAEAELKEAKSWSTWAHYANALLTGDDLSRMANNVPAGTHANRVTLFYEHDFDKTKSTALASVFLLCECAINVDKDQRVSSESGLIVA